MTDTYDTQSRGPFGFLRQRASGSPLSYEALQSRRRIAEALASKRSPFPKNAGEGLTYLDESLNDIASMRALDAQQRAYEAEGNKNAAEAARTLYGAGGDRSAAAAPTTDTQATNAAPSYAPSATNSVPLPPPRAVVNRDPQLEQMDKDPTLGPQLAAMALGEARPGASPEEMQAHYASALNRAGANNIPVAQALKPYTGPQSGGYYPPEALARGRAALQQPGVADAFERDIAKPVLRGGDPSPGGFTPTQNASLRRGEPRHQKQSLQRLRQLFRQQRAIRAQAGRTQTRAVPRPAGPTPRRASVGAMQSPAP